MTKISLAKREETLKISLKKAGLEQKITLRVAAALDISGSMQGLYRSGVVSDFVGKLLPFGMIFDDNAEVDMWAFDHGYRELPSATAEVYDDYVGKCMRGISISGGTDYAPVMQDIYNTYFGPQQKHTTKTSKQVQEPTGFFGKLFGKTKEVTVTQIVTESVPPENTMPAMVFFQTDGENSDDGAVRRLLSENANTPVYWFMVGVGNANFRGLKALAKDFPNVDFISVEDLALTDSELYDKLLSKEFGEWVKKMGAVNV